MSDGSILLLLGGLLAGSAFCSGSETALFALGDDELSQQEQRQNDVLSSALCALRRDTDRLLLGILVANNAINIAFFALVSYWITLREWSYPALVPLLGLLSLILFGEIIPKVIASERPLPCARVVAPLWHLLLRLLAPLMQPLQGILRPLTEPRTARHSFPTVQADEIKLVLEQSHRQGIVSSCVHDRMVDIIDLSRTPVYQVMTHRLDCCIIRRDTDHRSAQEALRQKSAAYLLVVDGQENAIGILGVQQLLRPGRLARRVQRPCFIPAHITLAQALELFQRQRLSAGVVVDEHGGTEGILTLAHLAQALLGAEGGEAAETLHSEQLSENCWRLSGNAPIAPWKTLLNAPQFTDKVSTIGGFLARVSGSIPQQGDRLVFNNLVFIVEATDGLRIRSIQVEKIPVQEARRLTHHSNMQEWH